MMTFKEMRTRNHYLYPETIPADLRNVINDWFDCREVCDDDKFATFFKRLLERDYHTYRELLRIEPGIAQYDWLVQQYREHERKLAENEQTSNTGSNSKTTEGYVRTVATITEIETNQETGNGQKTGSKNETANSNAERSQQGEYRDTTQGTTTDSENTSHNSNSSGENHTGDKALNKNSPMSALYADADINTDGGNHDGEPNRLSWNTLTSQAQTSHDGEEQAQVEETGERESEGTSEQTSQGDNSLSETSSHEDVKNGLYADNYNDQKNGRRSAEKNDNSNVTNNETSTHQMNAIGESNKYGVDRAIDSGRSIDIATLLKQSSDFIKKSEAWEWLYSRLDTCFIGIY